MSIFKKNLNDIKNGVIDTLLIWIYVIDLSLLIVIINYFKPDLISQDIVYYSGLFLCIHFALPFEFICNFLIWLSIT